LPFHQELKKEERERNNGDKRWGGISEQKRGKVDDSSTKKRKI